MASQVQLSNTGTVVTLEPELANAFKTACKNGVDAGFSGATPVAVVAARIGTDYCITKSTDSCAQNLKERAIPYFNPNNAPAVIVTVDSAKAAVVTAAKAAATPLVESCVQSTSTIAQQSMHRGIDGCVNYSGSCLADVGKK
ncbi:MAG TPA: hypothetical protein VIJ14_05980 [Rhabdochlamydiaceae bacterium]